jgi:glycosyltransferase involved in cell wall biosynthesis
MVQDIKFSVIIPVYNEEQTIHELYQRLNAVFKDLESKYEIIFIDDGSTDKSFKIIEELCNADGNLKVISLRVNSGKSIALSCGFEESSGSTIITLDSDLQDQPEDIPKFLSKLEEGYDLVSGWKRKRYDPFYKVFASRIFNFFTATFTGVKIHDFNNGFKAYRKDVMNNINLYGDQFRFIPAFAKWQGFRIGEVEVNHRPRLKGKSKFGSSKMFRGFFDLMTVLFLSKFSKRPLHFFGSIGMIIFIIGLIINLYLTVIWFNGAILSNRPILLLGALMIIIGIQFIATGLLGEMISQIFNRSYRIYPISKKVGNFNKNSNE